MIEGLQKLLMQPMRMVVVVLTIAGAAAIGKELLAFIRDKVLPFFWERWLRENELMLPFVDKILDKAWSEPQLFRTAGPKFVDFAKGRVYARPEINAVQDLLKSHRFVHIVGPPSSGKSVLALYIAYRALLERHTVLYFERPNRTLDHLRETLTAFSKKIDRDKYLIIVDDVHLAPLAASSFFSVVFGRTTHVRVLFVSRPITDEMPTGEDTPPFVFTQYMPRVEVTADAAASQIADFYCERRYARRMPPTVKQQFLAESANDLLILGRFLSEWDGTANVNLPVLREAVFAKLRTDLTELKSKSKDAVTILLILGLFYRFEIPVDRQLLDQLGLDVGPLVKSGDVIAANDFLLLHHSSLARLYSNAIQQGRMPEYDRLVQQFKSFPHDLFKAYVALEPRNFCDFIIGLRTAPDVLRAVITDQGLAANIKTCLERETDLPRLGWAIFVMFVTAKGAAWKAIENVNLRPNATVGAEASDATQLSLFLLNMSRVSLTKAREWMEAVPATVIVDRIASLPFRHLAGVLRRIRRISPKSLEQVLEVLDPDILCQRFLQEDDFGSLQVGIARLFNTIQGRVAVRVNHEYDFAGERTTRVIFYCDAKKAVRFFRGRSAGIPYSSSIRRRLDYSQNLVRLRTAGARIAIDDGAVAAVRKRASLFPVGVVSVDGAFPAGAVVEICTIAGTPFGVGVSNYSSEQLSRIKRRRSSEIHPGENILANKVFDNDLVVRYSALESLSRAVGAS